MPRSDPHSTPRLSHRIGRARRLAPLVAALVLAGCSLAPTYEQPALPVATDWPIAPAGTGVIALDDATTVTTGAAIPPAAGVGWRQFYLAPELQQMIELALENNRDLRIAILNIEEARAQYNIQRSELSPQIGVGATGQRGRTPGDLSPSGSAVIGSQYQVGVSMPSFEIDLFGRIRSLSDAALAQYLATEEARRNVQITLIAQVAEAWFNLYATTVQLKLTRQTLATREASYELVKARYDVGVGSALDLNQAETLLDSARSNLQALERQRLRARNALTLLTGAANPPLSSDETLLDGDPMLAAVPIDLPSTVLLSRPDVLAAEQELRAANANIGAARAAFFPNISLTALFGTASAQLSGLFDSGSHTWNFAPQIALPIFSAGALRGQLEVAELRRDIAVANYERTIQQAFREVSDALAGTATYQSQIEAESDLVAAAARSLDLSELRYENGVDSFLQVQDAERTFYEAQQGLVQTRLEELLNRVALYKALGGGWLEDTDGRAPGAASSPGESLRDMSRDTRPQGLGAESDVNAADSAGTASMGGVGTSSAVAADRPAASTGASQPTSAPGHSASAPTSATATFSQTSTPVNGVPTVEAAAPASPSSTGPATTAPATPASTPTEPAARGSTASTAPGGVEVIEQSTWRDAVRTTNGTSR